MLFTAACRADTEDAPPPSCTIFVSRKKINKKKNHLTENASFLINFHADGAQLRQSWPIASLKRTAGGGRIRNTASSRNSKPDNRDKKKGITGLQKAG